MKHFNLILILAMLMAACTSGSRRAEIEARKAALKHKQDSALLATQQELAFVDSTLEAVRKEYAEMEALVNRHREQLKATEEELTRLARLRMHRDSLEVRWKTLGAKIRYIQQRQSQTQAGGQGSEK